MVWHGRVIGLAVLVLFFNQAPVLGQELRGGGEVRSLGPATGEASKKIVSRLRGLIADFRTQGISSENAGEMGVAGRFSSPFLKVDAGGRVQVEVTVTDTSEANLDALRAHGLDVEIVNREFKIVQGWVAVEKLEALAGEGVVKRIRPPSYGRSRRVAGGQTRTGSVYPSLTCRIPTLSSPWAVGKNAMGRLGFSRDLHNRPGGPAGRTEASRSGLPITPAKVRPPYFRVHSERGGHAR